VIIVVQVGSRLVGLLVDAVSDILTHSNDKIQPMPDVASDLVKTFIQGMLALDDRMIGIVRLDSIAPAQLQDAA
jgi:purine-binding chemotaxis protein CheW